MKELSPDRLATRAQIAKKSEYGQSPEDFATKGMLERALLFWSRVDRSGDCWLWQGFRAKDGYGQTEHKGRKYGAHVLALLLEGRGPGPGQVVRHKCNNPPCVRPDHLLVGTQIDNVADRDAAGNAPKGERNGRAKLTEKKVKLIRALCAGGVAQADVARQVGISRRVVCDIVKRKTWKHVV